MTLIGQLLTVAKAFCEATGANLRQLGDRIFRDRRRFEKLRDGQADITTKSLESAMSWFSANWPVGIAWPEGVERPAQLPDLGTEGTEGQSARQAEAAA